MHTPRFCPVSAPIWLELRGKGELAAISLYLAGFIGLFGDCHGVATDRLLPARDVRVSSKPSIGAGLRRFGP